MRDLRGIATALLVVGCGGSSTPPPAPGPIVDSMTPTSGDWGTEVTIVGENFGATTGTSHVEIGSSAADGFVVDDWTETQVTGRVAFPATGTVSVATSAGTTMAGTFTTAMPWVPVGSPVDAVDEFDGIVLSSGAVAVLDHTYELTNAAALAVYGGSGQGVYMLAGLVGSGADPSAPIPARLVEADDGTAEVVATTTSNAVVSFGVANSALGTLQTGLSGTVLAAARDATGVYAWIASGSGVTRARPGTTWTVDRGPFALADVPLDAAVAPDGTLWVVVGDVSGSAAHVDIATLAPAGSAFGALEQADPTDYPGTITQARLSVGSDGVHALVEATDTADGSATLITPRFRTAVATWSDAPTVDGLVQYAFTGSTLSAIANDTDAKTITLVPDATMPTTSTVIPVFPMLADSFVVDGSGTTHALVTNGDVSYVVTPAP